MGRQVFGYRGFREFLVVGFLVFWCGFWLWGVVSTWENPRITVNERVLPREEALGYRWVFLAIGLAMALGTAALGAWLWNCRVEIEDREVRWFDFLGRLRVRGRLAGAAVEVRKDRRQARITTDGGVIRVFSYLGDYWKLRALLDDPTALRPPEGKRFLRSSYVPAEQTFSYRWGATHLFSFVWVAVVLGMLGMFLASSQRGEGVFYVVFALFLWIGVWLQMVGWNERIRLGPEGIEWVDWRGRSRVRADLNEIVGVEEEHGDDAPTLRIETLQGTIQGNPQLPGADRLLGEIRRLVAGRASR